MKFWAVLGSLRCREKKSQLQLLGVVFKLFVGKKEKIFKNIVVPALKKIFKKQI